MSVISSCLYTVIKAILINHRVELGDLYTVPSGLFNSVD